jgi:aspartyl-tRNA synthetase
LSESLGTWERTDYCGTLRREHVGRDVTVMGWAQTLRDHGGLRFVDLRDRSGVVQLVFNPEQDREAHARAGEVRAEYVVAARGRVVPRPAETQNPNLPTGEIEIMVAELRILNPTRPLPFLVEDGTEVVESTRLRHRYLDLRRPKMQRNLALRHRMAMTVREYFDAQGFVEIETPALTRRTPEGARDYLVPSRVNPGQFYALPQSPQLFKQLLMVSGFDRYFQIARCFRDEDLRADRQPEFTQIDVELSFTRPAEIYRLIEGLMVEVFRRTIDVEVEVPFPILSHAEAMRRFGSDKPDTRFRFEIVDFSAAFAGSGFKVFREVLEKGGVVRGLRAPGDRFSRKDLDDLVAVAPSFGAKGLAGSHRSRSFSPTARRRAPPRPPTSGSAICCFSLPTKKRAPPRRQGSSGCCSATSSGSSIGRAGASCGSRTSRCSSGARRRSGGKPSIIHSRRRGTKI